MERAVYVVIPAFAGAVPDVARRVRLSTWISRRGGNVFLWPAKLPLEGGSSGNRYSETGLLIAEIAETRWVRMYGDRNLGGYRAVKAKATLTSRSGQIRPSASCSGMPSRTRRCNSAVISLSSRASIAAARSCGFPSSRRARSTAPGTAPTTPAAQAAPAARPSRPFQRLSRLHDPVSPTNSPVYPGRLPLDVYVRRLATVTSWPKSTKTQSSAPPTGRHTHRPD